MEKKMGVNFGAARELRKMGSSGGIKNAALVIVIIVEILHAGLSLWPKIREMINYVDRYSGGWGELLEITLPGIFLIGVLSFVVFVLKVKGLSESEGRMIWFHVVSLVTFIVSRIFSLTYRESTAPDTFWQLSFGSVIHISMTLLLFVSEWQINRGLNGKAPSNLAKTVLLTGVTISIFAAGMILYKKAEYNQYWKQAISTSYQDRYTVEIDEVWYETIFAYHVTDGPYSIPAGARYTDEGELIDISFRSPEETPWGVFAIQASSPEGEQLIERFDTAVIKAYQSVEGEEVTLGERYDFDSGYNMKRTDTIDPVLHQLMQESREQGHTAFNGLADIPIVTLVEKGILIPDITVRSRDGYDMEAVLQAIDASALPNGEYRLHFLSDHAIVHVQVLDGKIAHMTTTLHEQGYRSIRRLTYLYSSTSY